MTYTYNNPMRASLSLQKPNGTWTNGYTWDINVNGSVRVRVSPGY
ncbi:MAG TPA: hypothetical protein VEL06_13055 [Haliangiales bacterium]|nr:hypothetical protein [Haliangiales bacterium]